LDKPYTNEEFLNRMQERNIEVSIIDHHEIKLTKELKTKANFFLSFPSSEPTSYLCQKIFNNKNTLWIALIGCVYDVFKPDFIEEFQKNYPNLVDSDLEISKMRYSSELGKITQILSLALKSSNISIQSFIELFLNADGPDSVLIEDKKNELLHKRYNLLNKVVEKNIRKAEVHPNLVFLEYSGEYSLSSDISNLLFFRNPDRFVAVCYKKQDWINVSLRGRDAKKFTEKIISKIENSSGGGHEVACGLRIPQVSFYEFKKILFDEFGKP
jgi:single-stranded DNA-specific DHH superfamily exonuclease